MHYQLECVQHLLVLLILCAVKMSVQISLIIIIIKSRWQQRFPWHTLSLPIRLYHLSTTVVLPKYLMCPWHGLIWISSCWLAKTGKSTCCDQLKTVTYELDLTSLAFGESIHCMDTTTACKISIFVLSDWSGFPMIDNLSMVVHEAYINISFSWWDITTEVFEFDC